MSGESCCCLVAFEDTNLRVYEQCELPNSDHKNHEVHLSVRAESVQFQSVWVMVVLGQFPRSERLRERSKGCLGLRGRSKHHLLLYIALLQLLCGHRYCHHWRRQEY